MFSVAKAAGAKNIKRVEQVMRLPILDDEAEDVKADIRQRLKDRLNARKNGRTNS